MRVKKQTRSMRRALIGFNITGFLKVPPPESKPFISIRDSSNLYL